ncbi:hypothetical protein L484_021968 [Morus notabilis]|uniref:Uncharacterized protein n=1 Tax=Morus notabilis TaxID=981085 RepID=W9QMJ6_9ROSA|nr:hypothetical protein L484_021968 [Morus notabilis]
MSDLEKIPLSSPSTLPALCPPSCEGGFDQGWSEFSSDIDLPSSSGDVNVHGNGGYLPTLLAKHVQHPHVGRSIKAALAQYHVGPIEINETQTQFCPNVFLKSHVDIGANQFTNPSQINMTSMHSGSSQTQKFKPTLTKATEVECELVKVSGSSFEVEAKDEQIGLETQSGSTIQGDGGSAKIGAQLVESTIKSIGLEDFGVKPLIFVDQFCGKPSIRFVDLSAKEAKRRQWRIAWVFFTFRRTIVLVPLWIWDEIRWDFSIGVYHSHKINKGLSCVDFPELSSFHIAARYYWFTSECFYRELEVEFFLRRDELM